MVCRARSFVEKGRLTRTTGGTEELIQDTLSRVGKVLHFRLVYDKDTGKPKGFGFAEFADADAAASAVRNLNDFDLMGRKLRVDWSNDNGAGDAAPTNYSAAAPMNGHPEPGPAPQPAASVLPPLPPGSEVPPHLTCPDAISRTLSTLPPSQLVDILSQMKALAMSDPAKATELLRQAPQLAYAIFQSLLLLRLVDEKILAQLIEVPPAAPAAPAPHLAAQNYPVYAPQPAPTPPVQAQVPMAYAPPQPPPQPAQALDQSAAYAQIMSMSQQQIDAFPPEVRAQILHARQLLLAGQLH